MDVPVGGGLRTQRGALLAAALVVFFVWLVVPYGRQLLYPVTLFAIWVHELGHGLTALAVGGGFDRIEIYMSGGLAYVTHPEGATAAVRLGGLLAPPVAGAAILLVARTPVRARVVLAVLALLLAGSAIIWVRSVVGLVAVPLLAALVGAMAWFGGRAALFTAQAIGVLIALDTVTGVVHPHPDTVEINGERLTSDVGAVADQLGGHYLLWGFLVSVVSVGVCVGGLWLAWRRPT